MLFKTCLFHSNLAVTLCTARIILFLGPSFISLFVTFSEMPNLVQNAFTSYNFLIRFFVLMLIALLCLIYSINNLPLIFTRGKWLRKAQLANTLALFMDYFSNRTYMAKVKLSRESELCQNSARDKKVYERIEHLG